MLPVDCSSSLTLSISCVVLMIAETDTLSVHHSSPDGRRAITLCSSTLQPAACRNVEIRSCGNTPHARQPCPSRCPPTRALAPRPKSSGSFRRWPSSMLRLHPPTGSAPNPPDSSTTETHVSLTRPFRRWPQPSR